MAKFLINKALSTQGPEKLLWLCLRSKDLITRANTNICLTRTHLKHKSRETRKWLFFAIKFSNIHHRGSWCIIPSFTAGIAESTGYISNDEDDATTTTWSIDRKGEIIKARDFSRSNHYQKVMIDFACTSLNYIEIQAGNAENGTLWNKVAGNLEWYPAQCTSGFSMEKKPK